MPSSLTYPGVYIEELPSGVHTITGVATSITAFVGWAAKGPVDRAEPVLNWSDFARKFGGLDKRSLLGYAVYQFFNNGGQTAYIVRLVTTGSGTPSDNAASGTVTLQSKTAVDVLRVDAANPGNWSSSYAIIIKARSDDATRFRLVVAAIDTDPNGVPVEVFENLSMDPSDSRFVTNVLANESSLVTATVLGGATDPPADTPTPTTAKFTKGNDGKPLVPNDGKLETALLPVSGDGGAYYLDRIDLFNILCVPGETTAATVSSLEKFCADRRAFLIVDAAQNDTLTTLGSGPSSTITGANATNAAFYFPWILAPDPLMENRSAEFPPCGFMAGLYSRTDSARGVWKAPAGTEASLTGVLGTKLVLTDAENGTLNPLAVNCIRNLPVYGTVAWGARTLQGNDERGSDWKYVPVRRTALYLEESLYRALKWVVFEPNDEPLWAQIRLNVGAFMQGLFRQGAFQGKTPREAYLVKCDSETTTQDDINRGIVNILVGFAPLKPAEFVVIQIQQLAGQLQA